MFISEIVHTEDSFLLKLYYKFNFATEPDRICFQANGLLKGTEVKDTFSFEEIKKIKVGLSIAPFRIVIILNDGDNWIFDQVNRKDAKKFAELYETINSN
nr:hypothetical protein [Staphylococcus cohnii]